MSGYQLLAIFLLLATGINDSFALTNEKHDVSCIESDTGKELHCSYRLVTREPVINITALAGDKSLIIKDLNEYPWDDALTAILLLVDTSDPARQNVIDQNKNDIGKLLTSAKPYHRIGLASFDKSLRLEVPVGVSTDLIPPAAERLRATGKTTELYRSILSAIDSLKNVEANRKSIFLFSDGLAEDRAYYHDDVVEAAKKAGVIITSLGYPRSVTQSVALQTLRRLSEETGGIFVEANNDFMLPQSFLDNPYESIDNGGRFKIDISGLSNTSIAGKPEIKLTLETDIGDYHANVPLTRMSGQSAEITTQTNIVPAAVPQPAPQPIRVITKESPEKSLNIWLWYVIPATLLTVLVVILAYFFFTVFRQDRKKSAKSTEFSEFKPYAYLVMQDETKKRYPITNTIWRIGRGKDNEMTLQDSSVSRRHAEINRDKGDVFTLIDLDSLNGVYVNNHKIKKHILREGDIIEVGDINLRFTLLSMEYQYEEATEMQNTKAPLTH